MAFTSTDVAAAFDEIANLHWSVGQARRGWLEAAHVLNTRPFAQVRSLLAATMGRAPQAQAA